VKEILIRGITPALSQANGQAHELSCNVGTQVNLTSLFRMT